MTPPKADKAPTKKRRGRPPKVKADDLPLDDLAAVAAAEASKLPPLDPEPEPPRDKPPGSISDPEPRRARKSRVTKKGTQQIEDALAEILQIPAVPAAMFGDTWMAGHFTVQGRALAERVALVSERNPVLRAWCEKALEGESLAVLLMASTMYVIPPLMHFGVIPGAEMLGVPRLGKLSPPTAPPGGQWTDDGPGPVPAEEVPAQQYGGEPVEVPAEEFAAGPSSQDPEKVVPGVHFAGGEDGPPVFMEQMIGG